MIAQTTLFGGPTIRCPTPLSGAHRYHLSEGAWVDLVPGWAADADGLFRRLRAHGAWKAQRRRMYDREVEVPRLLAGVPDHPACVGRVRELAEALSQHYGARFDRQMMALYRDGRDSVAWHGDKLGAMRSNALVGVLSLGGRRRFALRPVGGGRSRVWSVGEGDLVVMGGTCQATWEHCVPKVREAAPRIALMFRHSVPLCAGKPSDVGHSGRSGYSPGGGEDGASRRRS